MKIIPLRVLAATAIVAAGFCYVAGIYSIGLSDKNASQRDFISYWAAGQQLMHGANPYDFAAVSRLERAAGREDNQPFLVMRNPPIAFFLSLPLGLVSPKTGLVFWLLALLACLSVSIWILWLLFGCPENRFHLFGYVFAPSLACLMAGQFGIFLLLGVVLFLYFHQSRPFLAGASLLLCALKPHLFLPCAAALLLWVVITKAYQILAGFAASLLASCALSFRFDIHAWSQYSHMMRTGGALDESVPALSVAFRFLVDRNAVWLQFLPQTAACGWALWYFWKHRNSWRWMDQGLLLLLVSAMCTPFGWLTDESMVLPAVLYGIYCAAESGRSLLPLGLIAGIALIELFAGVQLVSPFFLWTTPAWLAWYLYATRNKSMRRRKSQCGAV
jgi:Glycosyltransferase family 87